LAQSKTTKQTQALHFESPPSKAFSFYPILIGGVRNLYREPVISETTFILWLNPKQQNKRKPVISNPRLRKLFRLFCSYWWGEKSLSGARHFRNDVHPLAQSKTTKQPRARHFESPPSKTFSFYPILIGGVRNLYREPGISETTFILWLNPKQQNKRKPVISNPHLRKLFHFIQFLLVG
jgi:hypothetical protein